MTSLATILSIFPVLLIAGLVSALSIYAGIMMLLYVDPRKSRLLAPHEDVPSSVGAFKNLHVVRHSNASAARRNSGLAPVLKQDSP